MEQANSNNQNTQNHQTLEFRCPVVTALSEKDIQQMTGRIVRKGQVTCPVVKNYGREQQLNS